MPKLVRHNTDARNYSAPAASLEGKLFIGRKISIYPSQTLIQHCSGQSKLLIRHYEH